MTNVLLVGKGPPDSGGISAFLQGLLASSLAERHQIQLLNLTRVEQTRGGRWSAVNVRRTIRDARLVWGLARDFDIVHVQTALVPLPTMLRAAVLAAVARARGARVIVHTHSGLVEHWLRPTSHRVIARVALRHVNLVVACSQGTRTALTSALGHRVVFVPNGVDATSYPRARSSNDPPRILYAGVLSPRKGVLDLIRASGLLHERGVAHELLLVGGSPEEGSAAEARVRATAGPAVQLLGARAHGEMSEVYGSADIFCLPSWWEAMPLTILEAMASGLPVVATDVGDVPLAVQDGTTGRLVPARRPDALADALQPLLLDATLRRAMGAAGRAVVEERFTSTSTVAHIERIYTRLGTSI